MGKIKKQLRDVLASAAREAVLNYLKAARECGNGDAEACALLDEYLTDTPFEIQVRIDG